jgi:DNA-binding response OmpR family regulator
MRGLVASDLVLLVSADPHEADRYAVALANVGRFAFVFAHDVSSAIAYAASMPADGVVVSLPGLEGIALCRELRNVPQLVNARLVLVLDPQHVVAAREASANAIIVRPASDLFVSIETLEALTCVERRTIRRPDRRRVPRGGRRLTDFRSN